MQTEGVVKSVSAAAGRSSFMVQPRHVHSALGHSDGGTGSQEPQPLQPQNAVEQLCGERSASLLAATRAELEDVIGEAQRLIDERRSAAEAEIAELRRQAEGELVCERAEMEQRLRAELQADYESRLGGGIAAIEALRAELEAERAACLPQLEADALGLVLELSRSLLLRELSTSPESVADLIAAALHKLRPQGTALIELDPKSCAALSELFEASAAGLKLGRFTLQLIPDSSLCPGQFRLSEGGRGIDVDLPQTVDECLAQIADSSGLADYESAADQESVAEADAPGDAGTDGKSGSEDALDLQMTEAA